MTHVKGVMSQMSESCLKGHETLVEKPREPHVSESCLK